MSDLIKVWMLVNIFKVYNILAQNYDVQRLVKYKTDTTEPYIPLNIFGNELKSYTRCKFLKARCQLVDESYCGACSCDFGRTFYSIKYGCMTQFEIRDQSKKVTGL